MHDIIGIDRNTICGNNRFRNRNKMWIHTSQISLIYYTISIVHPLKFFSFLRLFVIYIVFACDFVVLICSLFLFVLLSSSPSFGWFGKMFHSFFRSLETETIHLNFIRFHERELLSVHTGSPLACYNHDMLLLWSHAHECVGDIFNELRKLYFVHKDGKCISNAYIHRIGKEFETIYCGSVRKHQI